MERLRTIWTRFRLPIIAVGILASVAAGVVSSRLQGQPLVMDSVTSPAPSPSPSVPISIVVDIQGAVSKPGVKELPGDSLVADAIKAAGGFTQDADRVAVAKNINQAEALKDHQKVYIPLVGEGTTASVTPGPDSDGSGGLININTAGAEELEELDGVGPATAEKIIDYRDAFGGFDTIEELMEVSGIGEKTFEKMRDQVTV